MTDPRSKQKNGKSALLCAHLRRMAEQEFHDAADLIEQLELELAQAIERERLANMRADQADEALDAARREAAVEAVEKCMEICKVVSTQHRDGRKMPNAQVARWAELIADICEERIRAYRDSLKKEGA